VEPQNNIPDCTKTHTLKPALPLSLPGVQQLLHNINTHTTCGPGNNSGGILKELKEQTIPVLILILIIKRTLNTRTRNIVWYRNQNVTMKISYRTSHNFITQLIHLSRNKSGRFGAIKSDTSHHFFRNACTKSGSLRFSQHSGCWLILSVYILMSFDFPFVRLFGVRWFCYYPYV
jgi:hypothetical protein